MSVIPEYVLHALDILEKNNYEAFIVGGCVRDFIMNRIPNDYDVTTNATPQQIKTCFENFRCITTGEKHGTIAVVIDGKVIEITTYRVDGEYSDGRHPENVSFSGNLHEDLSRRDFTVNAMAMDKNMNIADIYGGREAVKLKTIETVGDAFTRFNEDALRIMRAIRFASQLGFEIEEKTSQQIHECRFLLKRISAERIRDEFVKLLCGKNAVKIIREYGDVIAVFIPEIEETFGFEQHTPYHKFNVWEHILCSVGKIENNPVLKITMLLHDIGKPDCFTIDEKGTGHFKGHGPIGAKKAEKILKRLKFPSKDIKTITTLIENHREKYKSDADIKKMMGKIGEDNFFKLIKVKFADDRSKGYFDKKSEEMLAFAENRAREIIENNECFKISHMEINGNDLLQLGVNGRDIGDILNKLLLMIINKEVENKREKLIVCANMLKNKL